MEPNDKKYQSKNFYKTRQFFIKSIYISIPIMFVLLALLTYFIYFWVTNKWFLFDSAKLGVFVGAISGLNGFFVAVTGFILALNKNNPITQKFFATAHPKYMLCACILGVITVLIALVLYLLIEKSIVILCFSAFSIGELMVSLYYIFYLFKQYISVETK